MQIMNKDLDRLLELQDMITKYDGNASLRNQKEYEQLKSKINEKLEKNEKLQKVIDEIRKIFQTYRDDNLYDFDTFNDEANAILKEVEE